MAEDKSRIRRIVAGLLAAIACIFVFASLRPGSPSLLRQGDVYQLDFANGAMPAFRAHLDAGSALHLRIDQQGVDVEITVTAKGAEPRIFDLPFGSMVREEILLLADLPTEYSIRVAALEGHGRPRLEVVAGGPATSDQRRAAIELDRYWQALEHEPAARLRELQELAEGAADPRVRLLAAATSASYDDDSRRVLASIGSALTQLNENPDAGLRSKMLIQRGKILLALGKKQRRSSSFGGSLPSCRRAIRPPPDRSKGTWAISPGWRTTAERRSATMPRPAAIMRPPARWKRPAARN